MIHVQDMPPSVVRAIAEIQTSMASVKRDGRNGHGGYEYASTDAIYAALSVKMGQSGLAMITLEDEPEIKIIDGVDKSGNPKKDKWCKFSFQFVLATEEGTWTDARCRRSLFIQITGAQTFMAAQSYAEKSFLRSLFKIPTGDLDLDALPQDADPQRPSSASAKREGTWESFQQEVQSADDLSSILDIEQRYSSRMPKRWQTPMYDALVAAREKIMQGFEI